MNFVTFLSVLFLTTSAFAQDQYSIFSNDAPINFVQKFKDKTGKGNIASYDENDTVNSESGLQSCKIRAYYSTGAIYIQNNTKSDHIVEMTFFKDSMQSDLFMLYPLRDYHLVTSKNDEVQFEVCLSTGSIRSDVVSCNKSASTRSRYLIKVGAKEISMSGTYLTKKGWKKHLAKCIF